MNTTNPAPATVPGKPHLHPLVATAAVPPAPTSEPKPATAAKMDMMPGWRVGERVRIENGTLIRD